MNPGTSKVTPSTRSTEHLLVKVRLLRRHADRQARAAERSEEGASKGAAAALRGRADALQWVERELARLIERGR